MSIKKLSFFLFLVCCSILLTGYVRKGHNERKKQKPNVLFIVFDDLNDWEGCLFGHPQTLTPNINRLAEQSVLFTNAHCPGTMCCPSRASVITGLRPTTTGVYRNSDTPFDLYKEKQTLNKHFKENGYFVAGAGKILHKFYYEENDWHEFVSQHIDAGIIRHKENPEKENITRLAGTNFKWGPFSAPDSVTSDAKTVDWVCERLERDYDSPFFLACGIYRPHLPWFVPEEYFNKHPLNEIKLPVIQEEDLNDVPLTGKNIAFSTANFNDPKDLHNEVENTEHETIKKDGLWDDAVQAYLASITYADAQLGKLLEALEHSPYADNTIIVLWSDNGWHLGEKEHWRKGTLWEQVTRVPLIIHVPDMLINKRCKQPVSLIDIYPTLIELCGLPSVEGLEGESLVPQLKNPDKKRNVPAITSLTPEYHAIRDGQFRYVTYGGGQEELYDHQTDPEEWTNLADDPDYHKVKEALKKFIPRNGKEPLRGAYGKKWNAEAE